MFSTNTVSSKFIIAFLLDTKENAGSKLVKILEKHYM